MKSIAFYTFDPIAKTSLIPVADGEFLTVNMLNKAESNVESTTQQLMFETGTATIEFFDADGETLIVPSAGTAQFLGKIDQNSWAKPGSGNFELNVSTIDYNDIANVPVFMGPMHQGKVTLASVAGASFFRATFWRV